MKISELGFDKEKVKSMCNNPYIRANVDFLVQDFKIKYKDTLSAEISEDRKEDVTQYITDLFIAFSIGNINSTDPKSNFRKYFNLPKEFQSKPVVAPSKKIIV